MSEITRVGADLAKHVIQVHAVDAAGKQVTNRALVPAASRPTMRFVPIASAVVATVGDFKQFKNGSQFGAWLG